MFEVRVIRPGATWLICANFDIDVVDMYWSETSTLLATNIWLDWQCIEEGDRAYVIQGLQRVLPFISAPIKGRMIKVKSIDYNLCDFQKEGLDYGFAMWAACFFAVQAPRVDINFNRAKNRYEFAWG